MSDLFIFGVGLIAFGLMLIGVLLTVLEFNRISADETSQHTSKASRPASEPREGGVS